MKPNTTPVLNPVTHTRYRPPVAKVYGTVRGVPFQQVFKTVEAAQRVAMQFNGFVVSLVH
jgi:hypothetical protein